MVYSSCVQIHFFFFIRAIFICIISVCVSDSAAPRTVAHEAPLARISQARILERVAISSSRGPSQRRG